MLTEARARPIRHVAVACLLMSTSTFSGCGIGYLIQAGHGQSQLLRARQPIDKLIASDSTDAALKARLELVKAARDFATRELALPDNGSYRSYAALGRPYVVWNVVAAPEFSVRPKTWWFPITGRVAYRGYFKEDNARQFAAGLEAEGFDTLVGGVTAYSTLGRFSDPVLDTMMPYGDLQLVGTIFHELAHQLVYVKSDSEFNEAFAVSVEQAGLKRWLDSRGQAAQLGEYRARQEQQAQIVDRFAAGRTQLDEFYRSSAAMPTVERRRRKRELLDGIGAGVRELERSLGLRTGYDAWLDAGLNNAHLASIATYYDCVPGFERLLAAQHGDLPAFYRRVRELARGPAAQRAALCARGSEAGEPATAGHTPPVAGQQGSINSPRR
jgi:predicted aminopeptidase